MNEKGHHAATDALVQSAMDYIEAHNAEKFSLRALSSALFVNDSYLSRLFKSHTGQTPLGYHHRVRCERAQALLHDTELSVSAVGEAVGFVSSAHFSCVFRKTTGQTPTEYRARRQDR